MGELLTDSKGCTVTPQIDSLVHSTYVGFTSYSHLPPCRPIVNTGSQKWSAASMSEAPCTTSSQYCLKHWPDRYTHHRTIQHIRTYLPTYSVCNAYVHAVICTYVYNGTSHEGHIATSYFIMCTLLCMHHSTYVHTYVCIYHHHTL